MSVTGPKLQPTLFERSRPGRGGGKIPHPPKDALDRLPAEALRDAPPALPEMNEPDVVRHYVNLSQLNHAVDTGFYPLGSCTMKFNPKLNEWAARLPGFAELHPLAPDEIAYLLEHYRIQRAEQRTTERDALRQRIHAATEHEAQAHPPGEQP